MIIHRGGGYDDSLIRGDGQTTLLLADGAMMC